MSMEMNMKRDGDSLTVSLAGRLDSMTAPNLEAELRSVLRDGVANLTLDLGDLRYVSSAGLHLLLFAQKVMSRQGKMTVRNVNSAVMEVFEVTGFVDLLNIED